MAAPFARLPVNIAFPDVGHPTRREAFARFLDLGWPTRKQESWRYTDLTALAGIAFAPVSGTASPDAMSTDAGAADTALPPGLSVWTGHNRGSTDTAALDAGPVVSDAAAPDPAANPPAADKPTRPDALAALHAAFAAPGLTVTGGEHFARHLVGGQDQPTLAAVQHRVDLPAGARATLVLGTESLPSHGDGPAPALALTRVSVRLAEGARLTLVRAPKLADTDSEWCRIDATLGPGATLDATGLDTAGRLVRTEFVATVEGPGARFNRSALMAASGKSHFDTQHATAHAAPDAASRGLFRNLADDRARVVLNDRVEIRAGADGTDSEQHIASWLQSARAEIDAKPELVIDADEVKAAHGNSFGRADPDQLFYLRARGLDDATARSLLRGAFVAEALALVPGGDEDSDADTGETGGLRGWLLARAGLA